MPDDALKLNLLILGFDSLSHNTFIRTLPKTYAFLTESLGAHIMEGHNVAGDGTPQQLIPMLTGKTGASAWRSSDCKTDLTCQFSLPM